MSKPKPNIQKICLACRKPFIPTHGSFLKRAQRMYCSHRCGNMKSSIQTESGKVCRSCNRMLPYNMFFRHKKLWQTECKDCGRARSRQWSRDNPEARSEYNKRHTLDVKKEVFGHYGGKCVCCGESELVFLAIDHINGGGTKHQKETGAGKNVWLWLRDNDYPPGFRVLCHNCNWAVAFGKICPHQRKQDGL